MGTKIRNYVAKHLPRKTGSGPHVKSHKSQRRHDKKELKQIKHDQNTKQFDEVSS